MLKQIRTIVRKYGVLLFFLIFFLYGMAVVRDYGISWDEAAERESSLINFGYVLPQARELVTDTVNYHGLPTLYDYYLRYYGVAGQFPTVLAEYLYQFRFNYQQVYLLRHMYTFFVFWTACIFFYLICKSFTHSRDFSLTGVFLLISSPRILADSFYNIKDLLFLSLFIITLFFGLQLLRKPTVIRLLAFGFFGGLCTNCRIVGAIPVICCVLLLGVKLFFPGQEKPCAASVFRKMLYCSGAGLLSFLFYVAFTPVLWQNPVDGLLGIIKTFSSYTPYTQSIFYMGEYPMTDRLPWHYLPVWILATTPVIHLLLMAAGALFQLQSLAKEIKKFFRHHHSGSCPESSGHTASGCRTGNRSLGLWAEKLFLFLNITVPLLYVLLFRPVLYNGWRHFYFVYPIMILAALYGIVRLDRWLRLRHKQYGPKIIAIGLIPVFLWIGQNHPFEYLYFNPIARPFAESCFEKDYWGVSQLDALQYICLSDSRDTVKVWTMTPSENRYFLSYEDQARIQIVGDLNTADYAIYNHTSTRSTEAISQMSLYQPVYVQEIDGMAVYTIFERTYTPWFSSRLKEQYKNTDSGEAQEPLSTVTTEVSGIDWTVDSDGQTNRFTGQLSEPVSTDRLRIETGNRDDFYYRPGDLEISVSEDGVHWLPAPLSFQEDSRYDYDFYCDFPEMELAYIRLEHHMPRTGAKTALEPVLPASNQSDFETTALNNNSTDSESTDFIDNSTDFKPAPLTWNMEIQILVPRSDMTDSHRDTVIEAADAFPQPEQTSFAFDNNLDTRWTSGTAQEAGMFFEIKLKQPVSLNQITLVQAGYRSDFPVNMEIFYSVDGVDWHSLPYRSDDMETFRFPLTQMRYVRFRIPEGTKTGETNWSVYEIELWRENGSSQTDRNNEPAPPA